MKEREREEGIDRGRWGSTRGVSAENLKEREAYGKEINVGYFRI